MPAHTVTKREDKGDKPPHATTYASVAGYPNLTVPMGLANGMPVGLTFIGPAWSEQTLLSYGYAYEQASHARVPPPRPSRYAAGHQPTTEHPNPKAISPQRSDPSKR